MCSAITFMTLRWPWVAAFAVFVACIPLFAWNHHFFGDWPNHLAMIGYFGEYLKAHGALPATFHTNETIGRATPLFYGNFCLPALGALSAVVGARPALSVGVSTLLLLQFASVRALLRDVTRDDEIACAAAVIVTWAIYPLTDLYNRAAIPEFFAITALQTGACLWALYARAPAARGRMSLGAGLLVTLAAGLHPPTALFGGLTFGVLWLASLLWCPERGRLLARSLAICLAAAGVLGPWLYVVTKFGGQLNIVLHKSPLVFFPTSLDAVQTRLSAMPTVGQDPSGVGTPNLDPQVSIPLAAALILLAIVALAARARDRQARRALAFAAICAAAMGALFLLSTCAPAWKVLPTAFTIIQYPYRLVAFVNLAALGALLGVLAALARDDAHAARSRWVLAVGVVVAMVGVGSKLPRCLEGGSGADVVVTDYRNPPVDWYFGFDDYATLEAFAPIDGAAPKQDVKLTVGAPKGFGVVAATHVKVDVRTQVSTNVQAFPWNVLTIDGHPVPREATLVDGVKLATWVATGEHEVGYDFRPDRAWLGLRALSLSLLAVWACAAVFGPRLVRRLSRRRQRRSVSARQAPRPSTPTSSLSA